MLRVLDLFSGIGGFSLGLERTGGFETVAFCEIYPYAQKVLKKHWPDVPIYEDIRSFDGVPADVICGGYPCQPYSVAGKRLGGADPRSLDKEMLRITERIKPTWFIGENVRGHIDLGLDAVCDELERLGYSVWPVGIPACAVGLPTMEWHLWIVATTDGDRLQRFRAATVSGVERVSRQFQGSDKGISERWSVPSSRVCGVGEGVPAWMDRLKCLGNAVVPQIPEIIGYAILEAENANRP